jgi:hypothetical protein
MIKNYKKIAAQAVFFLYLCARIIVPLQLEKENPIEEAQRYVDNAKQTLKDNGELDIATRLYGDRKYVRSAGHFLWNAVLIALDAVFHVKTSHRRPDIKDYKDAVSTRDRKLLALVNNGYDTMHIAMSYDGNQSKAVCDEGFRLANEIIKICSKMMPKQQNP